MNRRDFISKSLSTASLVSIAGAATSSLPSMALAKGPSSHSYAKYTNVKNVWDLTQSSQKRISRDRLVEQARNSIPSEERAIQITETVIEHIIAEEVNDVERTLATMVENPIFEDIPAGVTLQGHKDVAADYAARYVSFPSMKRHITNIMVDNNGCFTELIWEGVQKGSVRGVKPSRHPRKIYMPVLAYFEVNEQGLISRETAYYDQYIAMLNMDLIPDFLNKKFFLLMMNPGLVARLE